MNANHPTQTSTIKTYLREHGINQVTLAKKLGVTESTVSRTLRDGNRMHAATVARIAAVLGTTVPQMLKTKMPRLAST